MKKLLRKMRARKERVRQYIGARQDKLDRFSGLFSKHPVLMHGLAIAPAIVATQSLKAAWILSVGFFLIVLPTVLLVSWLCKKLDEVYRTIVSALLAAVLFVPVSILLTQFFPFISTNVGLYLPILIVDSLILTKCDLYIELGVRGGRFLDMLCTGLGFTLLICLLGALRELLAYGTLWGKNTGFPPVSEAVAMPFFGFFVIGLAAAGFRYCNNSFRHWINKKEEE